MSANTGNDWNTGNNGNIVMVLVGLVVALPASPVQMLLALCWVVVMALLPFRTREVCLVALHRAAVEAVGGTLTTSSQDDTWMISADIPLAGTR